MDDKNNSAITVTFCDRGENHIVNQKIANLAPEGFKFEELEIIHKKSFRDMG